MAVRCPARPGGSRRRRRRRRAAPRRPAPGLSAGGARPARPCLPRPRRRAPRWPARAAPPADAPPPSAPGRSTLHPGSRRRPPPDNQSTRLPTHQPPNPPPPIRPPPYAVRPPGQPTHQSPDPRTTRPLTLLDPQVSRPLDPLGRLPTNVATDSRPAPHWSPEPPDPLACGRARVESPPEPRAGPAPHAPGGTRLLKGDSGSRHQRRRVTGRQGRSPLEPQDTRAFSHRAPATSPLLL
ncbi:pollen-specific leucine-rich repeat extensin-like protein 1 [Hyaena hyaena]|uniref:pollen-specific leucine-rich repeat extensin-like protein 1 n=1 Tax=Hyaena hyaena TaxID=95912 RepID=UPI0019227F1E|nr:pollen-specific leucine-rich repeat extensin-like protein 1 [Hyaena hyaena]